MKSYAPSSAMPLDTEDINPLLKHSNSLHHETVTIQFEYPPYKTHQYLTHVREFNFNMFYCIRQHDKMLNTCLVLN
jgi:hypothetical protein